MSGPEVPFPLKENADRDIAEKFGFCRDCPFPLEFPPHSHGLVDLNMSRHFGRAQYVANEIAGLLTITASGMLPNLNSYAQLVQLPLMIWPPRFALYFISPDIVLPAERPFKIEATLQTHQRIDLIVVQDADGVHEVKVQNF